jgi:hypothetical protein
VPKPSLVCLFAEVPTVACCSEWEGHQTEGETEVETRGSARRNLVSGIVAGIGQDVGPRSRD